MEYCKCEHCGIDLKIEENDTMPGCREMEEVYCPECKEIATKVFTSGIPRAYVVTKKGDENS